MKNAISTFITKCRNFFRPENQETFAQKRFREFYLEELEYVKKHPEFVAWNFASDREDEVIRGEEDKAFEKLERQRRAEQIMERGKTYTPTPAPSREKDEPDLEPN